MSIGDLIFEAEALASPQKPQKWTISKVTGSEICNRKPKPKVGLKRLNYLLQEELFMGAFSRIVGAQNQIAANHKFTPAETVSLDIEERRSSRLLTKTLAGTQCVIILPRGLTLRGGTVLANDEGQQLLVLAAPEQVSTITSTQDLGLTRLAYHLGNRHVPLEITPSYLRYQHDHVLDEMVKGLGGTVTLEQAPFEPEDGAYSHHH